MPARDIQGVYHITHIDNVRGILRDGVLSHNKAINQNPPPVKIYNEDVVARRKEKEVDGKSLWDFANCYFNPRNPMLFHLRCEKERREREEQKKQKEDVVILQLHRDALDIQGAQISVGNAAAEASYSLPAAQGVKEILKKNIWEKVCAEYWNSTDEGKRIIMSELLVPDSVPASMIRSIYVADSESKKELEAMRPGIPIVGDPRMFFQPHYRKGVTNNVSLVEGDMFFSNMHTFTISVNTKGVMGKGLASRTKYQFPDVYVKYQDACRRKKITPETPFLYKRESFLDTELSDAPEYIKQPNNSRWFLLFATKRDWRDDSRLEDIEAGLHWIEKNYAAEGIKSLALPALGCGLGGLKWGEVGPLMCQTLARLSIHSSIYLPRENVKIPEEQKSPDFLLKK